MRALLILASVGAAAMLLDGVAAFAGEGVNLTITNDGVEDIYVSVYDSTTKAPLAEHQRLNGFTSITISANPDDAGAANISWTTISVDNRQRHCGQGSRAGIENDTTVIVHADSSCQ